MSVVDQSRNEGISGAHRVVVMPLIVESSDTNPGREPKHIDLSSQHESDDDRGAHTESQEPASESEVATGSSSGGGEHGGSGSVGGNAGGEPPSSIEHDRGPAPEPGKGMGFLPKAVTGVAVLVLVAGGALFYLRTEASLGILGSHPKVAEQAQERSHRDDDLLTESSSARAESGPQREITNDSASSGPAGPPQPSFAADGKTPDRIEVSHTQTVNPGSTSTASLGMSTDAPTSQDGPGASGSEQESDLGLSDNSTNDVLDRPKSTQESRAASSPQMPEAVSPAAKDVAIDEPSVPSFNANQKQVALNNPDVDEAGNVSGKDSSRSTLSANDAGNAGELFGSLAEEVGSEQPPEEGDNTSAVQSDDITAASPGIPVEVKAYVDKRVDSLKDKLESLRQEVEGGKDDDSTAAGTSEGDGAQSGGDAISQQGDATEAEQSPAKHDSSETDDQAGADKAASDDQDIKDDETATGEGNDLVAELRAKNHDLNEEVDTLESENAELADKVDTLQGRIHWVNNLRAKLKRKLASRKKSSSYPGWHAIGFGNDSAIIAGPGGDTKVLHEGDSLWDGRVVRINPNASVVRTTQGVIKAK